MILFSTQLHWHFSKFFELKYEFVKVGILIMHTEVTHFIPAFPAFSKKKNIKELIIVLINDNLKKMKSED